MKANINQATYIFLLSQGDTPLAATSHIFKRMGTSQSKIGRSLGVSHQFVGQVISGERKTERVQKAIIKALGFNPWA